MSLVVCSLCGFQIYIPHCTNKINYIGICAPCLATSSENQQNQCRMCHENITPSMYMLKRKLASMQKVNLFGKLYSHLTMAVAPELIPHLEPWQFKGNNHQYKCQAPINKQPLLKVTKQKQPIVHYSSKEIMNNTQQFQTKRSQGLDENFYRQIMMANEILNEPFDYQYHLKKDRQRLLSNPYYSMPVIDVMDLSQYPSTLDGATYKHK